MRGVRPDGLAAYLILRHFFLVYREGVGRFAAALAGSSDGQGAWGTAIFGIRIEALTG